MGEREDFWFSVVLIIILLLVSSAVIWTGVRDDRLASACVNGGYAEWVRVGRTKLCIGVGEDGQWKAKPLEDVRLEMEGR